MNKNTRVSPRGEGKEEEESKRWGWGWVINPSTPGSNL